MKTEITRIKIKLSKDREIELNADEARKLHEELGLLFEKAERNVIDELKKLLPAKEYVPYPVYPQPIVIEREPHWWKPYWYGPTITCGGIGGGTSLNTGLLCMNLCETSTLQA